MEKQLSKRGITSLFFYIILVLISVLFLSLFSYYTSPLSNCDNGYDAAFFRLVGQGMTKGYLPYRDFFDMKGPYLFLIEYIGQLLSYGRLGIFIIQSINLYVSIIIIGKIYTLFHIHNHLIQIALLSPLAYVACFTWEGGNLTEELSLIPLFSCLFLCLMYLNSCENNNIWKEKYYLISGFWFGGCFGIIVLIRMTNALLICAMVLTIIISLIEKRKFQELIVCAGMFLTGLLAAVLPVIIYYGIKGLLNELVDAVFVLGFKYSGEKTYLQHVFETIFGEGNQRIWMIIIPCFIPFILNWRSWRERLFILIGAICTFFAVSLGNNYNHYYTLTIPLLVLCEVSIIESIRNKLGKKNVVVIIIFFSMLFLQVKSTGYSFIRAYDHIFHQDIYMTKQYALDISSCIPDEEKQSVFCYNINPAWYTYADIFPCIKYCGWQNHYITLMPDIYEDLQTCFLSEPPSWLVLPVEKGVLPEFIDEMLGKDYQIVDQNDYYILYQYHKLGDMYLYNN